MSIPVNEQETAFVFKRNSDKATIISSDERILAKLHEFVKFDLRSLTPSHCYAMTPKNNPNEWKLIDQVKIGEEIVSETFECPRKEGNKV